MGISLVCIVFVEIITTGAGNVIQHFLPTHLMWLKDLNFDHQKMQPESKTRKCKGLNIRKSTIHIFLLRYILIKTHLPVMYSDHFHRNNTERCYCYSRPLFYPRTYCFVDLRLLASSLTHKCWSHKPTSQNRIKWSQGLSL